MHNMVFQLIKSEVIYVMELLKLWHIILFDLRVCSLIKGTLKLFSIRRILKHFTILLGQKYTQGYPISERSLNKYVEHMKIWKAIKAIVSSIKIIKEIYNIKWP